MVDQCIATATGEADIVQPLEQAEADALAAEQAVWLAANPELGSKEYLKIKLAHYRWLTEEAGILWNGVPIRTDARSRSLLANIQPEIDRRGNGAHSRRVKTMVGFQSLTDAQLAALYTDVVEHYQKCFDAEDLVIPKIDDGTLTTQAEVETEFDTQYAAL